MAVAATPEAERAETAPVAGAVAVATGRDAAIPRCSSFINFASHPNDEPFEAVMLLGSQMQAQSKGKPPLNSLIVFIAKSVGFQKPAERCVPDDAHDRGQSRNGLEPYQHKYDDDKKTSCRESTDVVVCVTLLFVYCRADSSRQAFGV